MPFVLGISSHCLDIMATTHPSDWLQAQVAASSPARPLAYLLQAVLMVWVWLAILEGAAQYVEFLGVGVHCIPAQVACARHSMDALHSCDSPAPR
jgi:hypothetical protein